MNILTFDIEDWFHIDFSRDFNIENKWGKYHSRVETNTDIILDILEEKNIKATFFCLGWIGRKYPKLIRKIHNLGHEIGSHSDIHNLLSVYNFKEFDEDLNKSLDSLENVIGEKIKLFRAPAFSIGKSNLWAFDVLHKNGIEVDCSVFPSYHDFGGFPELKIFKPFIIEQNGFKLKEFPMSIYRFFGKKIVVTGGGYFRFFPFYFIEYFIRKSSYNMTYFHPRDLDANQPLLENLSIIRKFKSYYGLKESKNKFKKLLDNYEFINIEKANSEINWDDCDKINLSTK